MERLVLVHGSVTNGPMTWGAQRALGDRWELVVLNRPGFPPGPPVERVDFERDAEWLAGLLQPGDHLCGHSYGGGAALLTPARFDGLASLTVIEPPATSVARGDPAADAFAAGAIRLWSEASHEPEAFLREFLQAVGSAWRRRCRPRRPARPGLQRVPRRLPLARRTGQVTKKSFMPTGAPRPARRGGRARSGAGCSA